MDIQFIGVNVDVEFNMQYIISDTSFGPERGPFSNINELFFAHALDKIPISKEYELDRIKTTPKNVEGVLVHAPNNSFLSVPAKLSLYVDIYFVPKAWFRFASTDDLENFSSLVSSSITGIIVRITKNNESYYYSPLNNSSDIVSNGTYTGNGSLSCDRHVHLVDLCQYGTAENDAIRSFDEMDNVSYFDKIPYICREAFHQLQKSRMFLSGNLWYQPLGVVSFVLTVVSILCLWFVLLTFLLYPSLRNLQGNIITHLVTSLGLAQSLFLLSTEVNFQSIPALCRILAIATNYMWLSVSFWLLSAAVHVVIAFKRFPETTNSESPMCGFLLLSYIAPIPVVGCSTIFHLDGCDPFSVGYGNKMCLLSNLNTVAYFFALPLGLALTATITCFVMVIYYGVVVKRYFFPTMERDCHSDSRRMLLLICITLTCLISFAWIAGLLAGFVKNIFLWYFFTVLNSLQGVAVFVTCLCSKRVRKCYKTTLKNWIMK